MDTTEEKLLAAKAYLKERFKGSVIEKNTKFKYVSGPSILRPQVPLVLEHERSKIRRVK